MSGKISAKEEADALVDRDDEQTRQIRNLRHALDEKTHAERELLKRLDLLSRIDGARATPPIWLSPKESKRGHRATACLLVTDTHFEEVVRPEEFDFLNAYDRRIALMRWRKCIDQFIVVMRDYMKGITYDGVLMPMTGDIFSGNIHEELIQTNVSTLFDGLLYWIDPVVAAVRLLADEFGKVHIPAVAGNHGRQTKKPRAKLMAKDNLDWLFYKVLAREFRADPRVTFQIPDGATVQFTSYGTRFIAEHGNNFRGGSGIAGALSPLMLASHRKTRKHVAMKKPYDVMISGHVHQFINMVPQGILVGPALKGYDEHSDHGNYAPDYRHPDSSGQAFWLSTPEHGVTMADVIWTADRKAEGW